MRVFAPFAILKETESKCSRILNMLERYKKQEEKIAEGGIMPAYPINIQGDIFNTSVNDIIVGISQVKLQIDIALKNVSAKAFADSSLMLPFGYVKDKINELKEKDAPPIDYIDPLRQLDTVLKAVCMNKPFMNTLECVSLNDASAGFFSCWCTEAKSHLASSIGDTLKKVLSAFPKNTEFNLIDVNCGDAAISDIVCGEFSDINMYGISGCKGRDGLSNGSDTNFRRIVFGGIENTRITKSVFDVALAIPTISILREYTENSNTSVYYSTHKKILDKAIESARVGGYVVYAINAAFMDIPVARMLARALEDVDIYKTELKHTYIIVGKKIPATFREVDMSTYNRLRELITIQPDDFVEQEHERKPFPEELCTVKTFRSLILDDNEIIDMISSSPLRATYAEKQKANKLLNGGAHPLLPFTVGQIGIILTSGCLDGVIDEGNGCSHIIKGRVIKSEESETNTINENTTETTTTFKNKVEISMFLPDGTFKRFA